MTSNLIAGEKCYSYYRLKDMDVVDHMAYINDYGWTCIVFVAGLLFAAVVLAG